MFSLIVSSGPNKHWERAMEEKNCQLEVFAEAVKIQMNGLQKVSETKEEIAKFSNHYIEWLEHCDLRFYEKYLKVLPYTTFRTGNCKLQTCLLGFCIGEHFLVLWELPGKNMTSFF
jgi:hypothetical protein